jgi:uncharacterized membrane protein YhaH (DUF805 family)
MGFGEAISTCFRKYATFSGRARRSEYWYFYLFSILAGFAAGILDAVFVGATGMGETFRTTSGPFAAIVNLALLLPSLAVTVRRMHDTGRSGWLILGFIGYIIVGVVAFIAVAGVSLNGSEPNGAAIAVGAVLALGGLAFAIFLFVLMVLNGHHGDNKYGPDPKGPNVEVFS